MSFYRTILAVVASAAIVTPAFADDAATTGTNNITATHEAMHDTTDTTAVQSTDDNGADHQAAPADEATKVDLNSASTKDLMKVQGVDAAKARAIVAYRKKHGNFTTIDGLAKVKGFTKMNPDTMKKIIDQVTVN